MGVVDMKSIARLIAAAALAALVSGCTSNPTASTGGGGMGGAGFVPGTLRIADIQEPDTLNPYISTSITAVDLSYLWGEYFYNHDGRANFVPEVALAVPTAANGGISPDGLTISYHLRRGLKWADG
jgi:peptide/nickel transport system substrate-binding protein